MRIELRKYIESDLDRHLELFLMNGICKKIDKKIKIQEKDWLKKVIENYEKEEPDFFVMAIILDGELIGNLIAEKIDYKNKISDVGFWIGEKYWNRGIVTKALKIFLDEIVRKFEFVKIFAYCKNKNISSCVVLEKTGFCLNREDNNMKIYTKLIR